MFFGPRELFPTLPGVCICISKNEEVATADNNVSVNESSSKSKKDAAS